MENYKEELAPISQQIDPYPNHTKLGLLSSLRDSMSHYQTEHTRSERYGAMRA